MTDETLQRFFDALVEALRERSPNDDIGPFTVAEIYQDLVPYRVYRDRLGFEMNGDYEHALLRLLAGQGGFLRLESEPALAELRSELEGLNPDTSLYRDFAAVDVRVEPGMLPPPSAGGAPASPVDADDDEDDVDDDSESGGGDDVGADERPMGGMDSLASDAGGTPDTSEASTAFVEGAAPGTSEPVSDVGADGGSGGICPWCRSDLPPREGLVFCPFCGENQARMPCTSCGEALEPDWEFCISCGERKAQ